MGIAVLFVIPMAIGGIFSVALDPQGLASPMGCAVWPTAVIAGLAGIGYALFGEGALCIVMILPLWVPAAIGGTLVNRWLRRRRIVVEGENTQWRLRSSAWVALPALALATDAFAPPVWQEREVVRETVIHAAPARIWPLLVSIPAIRAEEGRWNPTHDLLGIPRPTAARLVRQRGELVRQASWGPDVRFEERVTELEPGKSIAWSFAFPDDSVKRHTDRHIAPVGPMLRILSGRYDVAAQPDGSTRVRLTTRYAMRVRLSGYFAWWGERLLGDVQDNVLAIVHDRAQIHNRDER